jgi:hypothetical protein
MISPLSLLWLTWPTLVAGSSAGDTWRVRFPPDEAVKEFESALDLFRKTTGARADHPVIDEMRRSLLYAHRCALDSYQSNGLLEAVRISQHQIAELRKEIHQIEYQREIPTYGRRYITLESIRE